MHARAIGAAGGRLVTVYDVVEPAAKSLAADTGASVARSVEDALHHPEVDAVLVVTSSDTHDFDMARWLLGEEPVSIYSRGSCLVDQQIGKLGDIDTACVVLMTSSGKQAVILNSRRAAYGYAK